MDKSRKRVQKTHHMGEDLRPPRQFPDVALEDRPI